MAAFVSVAQAYGAQRYLQPRCKQGANRQIGAILGRGRRHAEFERAAVQADNPGIFGARLHVDAQIDVAIPPTRPRRQLYIIWRPHCASHASGNISIS